MKGALTRERGGWRRGIWGTLPRDEPIVTAEATAVPTWTPPRWLNTMMKAMLFTPGLQLLVGRSVALITVTGRRTDTQYTIPVTYHRDGDTIVILTKRMRTWWRNLENNPAVDLRVAGEDLRGEAEVAAGDLRYLPDLIKFLEHRQRDAKAYGVTISSTGEVNEAEARAVLSQLVLIKVALVAPATAG